MTRTHDLLVLTSFGTCILGYESWATVPCMMKLGEKKRVRMVTVRDAQSPCHNVNHLEEGTADFTITPIFFTPALSQIFGTWPNRMLGFCEPGSLLTLIFFILDHVWSFIIIIIIYTGPKMMFGQV